MEFQSAFFKREPIQVRHHELCGCLLPEKFTVTGARTCVGTSQFGDRKHTLYDNSASERVPDGCGTTLSSASTQRQVKSISSRPLGQANRRSGTATQAARCRSLDSDSSDCC